MRQPPGASFASGTKSPRGGSIRAAFHRLARFRPDRFTLFLAALAAPAAALVLLRGATYGVGLQVDSAAHIAAARNLLAGNGLIQWNGTAYMYAPPLFPLTLAFAGLFGLDAVEAAGYVNAAAFGLTVFATAMWLRSRVRSRFLVVWAGGVCALAPPLTYFASEAMTEALFILFVVLSLFALDRFLESGKPLPFYLGASCAALASATRYPGIVLAAAAAPLLLLRSGAALPARARNAAVFAGAAAAPICLWLLRNFLVGIPLIDLDHRVFTPAGSLHSATAEFLKWSLGASGFAWLQKGTGAVSGINIARDAAGGVSLKIAFLFVLAVGTVLAIRFLRRRGYLPSWRIIAVPAVFAAAYALFLTIVLPLINLQLNMRFLAPLYVPALVAAAAVLSEFLRCAEEKGQQPHWNAAVRRRLQSLWRKRNAAASRAPAFLIKACFCLWLGQQVFANYGNIQHRLENGSGYASREWYGSEVVRYMKSRLRESCVWSTESRALYFMTAPGPLYHDLPPNKLPYDIDKWRRLGCEGGKYAVWFYKQHHKRYDYGLKELAALPALEIEAALKDGVIFKINNGKDAGGGKAAQGETLRKAVREGVLRDARPVIRADFDVYLDENANKLIYIKETCSGNDLAPRFFLHVVPENNADLPRRRRPHAFDNLNFDFDEYGFETAGLCAAARDLPDYAIAEIETGQWLPREDRKIWAGEFRPD